MAHHHHDTTLTVFYCRMARTRGGKVVKPVAPPRVYMMPNGVKVRRMDGGFRYQPPSLKTLSSILLDQTKRDPSPNLLLYQSVQKVLDKLSLRLNFLVTIGFKCSRNENSSFD